MFGKKTKEKVTVVKVDENTKVYATGAIRRDGSNLSAVNRVINIWFKRENNEEFALRVSEKKAMGLHEGVQGTVVYKNGTLIEFLNE
ncbi:MAG: hypothetical protein IIY77_06790 [Lachnospiraceae bacterium]|nr:hypothetical protein [Lachnospiraceae bacterium]